ncbi:hypothetical protein NDU88_006218 [Pleurodeles waltl]|uniref:Uncharacterized protein n=1 Tax=Pleurodeles waltl TaxID=8319 RepID=A0AAV7MBL0_PLEWA|nr:hypothetical protein NDU88_006218 [Pleurodeles waltl]
MLAAHCEVLSSSGDSLCAYRLKRGTSTPPCATEGQQARAVPALPVSASSSGERIVCLDTRHQATLKLSARAHFLHEELVAWIHDARRLTWKPSACACRKKNLVLGNASLINWSLI